MASEGLNGSNGGGSESSSSSKVHATGLGVMPSMSTECTPLKHRYDACFNSWFEEYLGLPPVASSSASVASDTTNDSGVSGFFSSKKGSSGSSSSGSGPSASERKRLRERLEGDCGAFWKEYQTCVLKAVKEKDLEELIQDARIQNPFPFPQDRKSQSSNSKPNNDPFPFPAQDTPSSST